MNRWQIELLAAGHRREDFDCGEESLNDFLRHRAGQNARKDISRTYVALEAGSEVVAGYYTLSGGSVAFEDLPANTARRLPKYPIPTALIGRLAVDRSQQGLGLGGMLLVDALKRIRDLADQIGIHAVTVHALNDPVKGFYEAHGFLPFQDDPRHLFLPLATIRKL